MNKKKIYHLLWAFVLLLLIASCNKDDSNNPDPVNNIPSAFEITVSEITFTSAQVDWSASTSEEPTAITYSIYLNNALLEENLSETSYNLTDLESATTYILKVKAKNQFGTTPSSKEFSTLQPRNLRLKSYGENILEYNELGLLTYRGDPSTYGFLKVDYTYDQNNNILTEYARHYNAIPSSATLTYTYSNDLLVGLTVNEKLEDVINKFDFDFQSKSNYLYTRYSRVDFDEYNYSYEVQLELDANDNVVKYTRTNTETSAVDILNFEYNNGNLTKITSNGNVLEISYDTSNNWHTYRSGFMPDRYYSEDIGGLYLFPSRFIPLFIEIPQFYDFVNTNNPIEYKYNGGVLYSFQHEYNQHNYPNKITVPELNSRFNLEYESIE